MTGNEETKKLLTLHDENLFTAAIDQQQLAQLSKLHAMGMGYGRMRMLDALCCTTSARREDSRRWQGANCVTHQHAPRDGKGECWCHGKCFHLRNFLLESGGGEEYCDRGMSG